jgi:hypothetical protein
MFTAASMKAIIYHGSLMPFLGIYVEYNAPNNSTIICYFSLKETSN